MIPGAVAPLCVRHSDDVAPKMQCEDASEIPAQVIPVPVIAGEADP